MPDFKDNPKVELDEIANLVILTEDQCNSIVEAWNKSKDNPPSINDLQKLIFGEIYDLREKPALAVKKFLASKNITPPKKSEKIVLDESQKKYIVNNAKNTKPLEMARFLFKNPKLSALHREAVAVFEFLATQDSKVLGTEESDYSGQYGPPKRPEQAAARINRATYDGTIKNGEWKTNSRINGYLESLIKFCHHPRFVRMMSKLEDDEERKSFELSFIAYVWDKVDLTVEEIDLYIDLCDGLIQEDRLNAEVALYTNFLEDATNEADGKKTSLSISDHLNTLRESIDKNKKHRKEMITMLQGKRSERVESKKKENSSILNLIDVWQRDESKRKQMIKYAIQEKDKLREELDKLDDMDAIKALIAGLTKEDYLA